MAAFDYTQFHLFDKAGNEIPVVYNTNFKIVIPNSNGDSAVFYAVTNTAKKITGYHKITGGNRFNITGSPIDVNAYAITDSGERINMKLNVNTKQSHASSSYSSVKTSISIDSINSIEHEESLSEYIGFPSTTFTTGLTFSKISTGLVETQSLYILVKEGNSFCKMSESKNKSLAEWSGRYKLLFFIDNRTDKDFQFFTTSSSDEIIWKNNIVIDANSDDETSYRVNIGFSSEDEGLHEGQVAVCIIDTVDKTDEGYDKIYLIGSINLTAEAVGEDERYRTLFTNFGVPDPISYQGIFSNTDLNEDRVDNILLNQNSKKLFLSYSDIFPYAGTYKALVNAINALGYTDLYFKEWYKNINPTTSQGKYTALNLEYGSTTNSNTINNLNTEERVKLKKLNWLSMIYKINEQLESAGVDKFDFPTVSKIYGYNNSDLIVKLTSLREWLEKYVIGLNCRIIEIGGEGIYFERYRLDAYSTYQTILEWNNEKNIAPLVVNSHDDNVLIDTSAYIKVNLGVDESNTTLEDLAKYKFSDFCEGYIGSDAAYHHMNNNVADASVFVGGTLQYLRGSDTFGLKASSSVTSFLFNDDFIKFEDTDENGEKVKVGSKLKVSNDEIFFNPYDLFTGHTKCAPFIKLPIIQIERANLRYKGQWENSVVYAIYPNVKEDTLESYIIENKKTGNQQTTVDYVTFVPPTYTETNTTITISPVDSSSFDVSKIKEVDVVSDFTESEQIFNKLNYIYGLNYSAMNPYNTALFSILGYQVEHIKENISANTEFYLEILDGKMIFPDPDNNRVIYLNFNFDSSAKIQSVSVNIVYNSDEFTVTTYDGSTKHFIEGNEYSDFVAKYTEDPESAISHNFIHSIKVNNSGHFLVDVYERDMHNNIFAANCNNLAFIEMPHFDLYEYTNESSGVLVEDPQAIKDKFIDFCIYSPTAMSAGLSVDKDNFSIKYPTYSYSMHNTRPNDIAHAVNITDMYKIDAIDRTSSTLAGTSLAQSLFESYNLVLSAESSRRFTRVMDFNDEYAAASMNGGVVPKYNKTAEYDPDKENTLKTGTMTDYLNLFSDSNSNFADVNVVFYNELNAHPIYQTYATLANDSIFENSPYKNKFRMIVPDESGKSYVWADMLQCTEGYLRLSFADDLNTEMQGVYESFDNVYYMLSEYMHNTIKDASMDNCILAGKIDSLDALAPFTEFLADCETYKNLVYDTGEEGDETTPTEFEYDTELVFNMLAGSTSKKTNILYDVESFIVASDASLMEEAVGTYYTILNDPRINYFYRWIGEHSKILTHYVTELDGFSYDQCEKYFQLAVLTACEITQNLDITKAVASTDIMSDVCVKYADYFTTDDLTSNVYSLANKDGNTITQEICEKVVFTDLFSLAEGELADSYGPAIATFSSLIGKNKEMDDAYYVTSVYGLMTYVTVEIIDEMLKTAKKHSMHFNEISSRSSRMIYNRFVMSIDEEINKRITEIAYNVIKAFAIVLSNSYADSIGEDTLEIEHAYVNAKDMLCNAIFDKTVDGSKNISIYHKFINNAAYAKCVEMTKQNWVMANKLEYCENIDDVTKFANRCKFAVMLQQNEPGTKKYYAKNDKYGDDGYSDLTYDVPMTAGVSISDLANKSYVSMYVKPIWMNRINAYLLDRESVDRLKLNPSYNYLCVNYKNGAFTTRFKPGEKVKLVFQSVQESEYIGQSTYEVVGYDILKNYMILRGTINSAYVNNNAEELWGYLPTYSPDEGKTQYAMIPSANASYDPGDISNVKNADKTIATDTVTKILLMENTTYIRVDTENSSVIIPVKYVKTTEKTEDGEVETGYWMYQLYAIDDATVPYAININASKIEKVNIYISYAHHGFVDYSMKAADFNEYTDGTSNLEVEHTYKNGKYLDFIDDTFSVMSKSFDIDKGVYYWMPGRRTGNKISDVEPMINDLPIYMHNSSTVEVPVLNSNVMISSSVDTALIDNKTSYKYWRVYKNDWDNSPKLLFESYNPDLFLRSNDKGIYDVEATIYDNYGNESTHMFKGAYIVK